MFYKNETKNFKFISEQYYNLEKEYNRYSIYKSLIKQIENILKILDSYEQNNRKKYENKNIIDRFILECINHGITPNIQKSHIHTNTNNNINNLDILDKEINYDTLSHHIFFNPILDNIELLRNVYYFTKMINEYNEKKITMSPEKQLAILKAISNSNKQFANIQHNLQKKLLIKDDKIDIDTNGNASKNITTNEENINKEDVYKEDVYKEDVNKDIICSLTLKSDDYIIVKYRDYSKTLSLKRYSQLIKNYDRPYPYDMVRMLLRYSIFDMSNQQWSIGKNLYDDISETFNISFEMFASPLNFNMNMFCSIFLDTDRMFGSLGSFYNLTVERMLNQNIKGVVFNPPYLPLLMSNCTKQCINILDEMSNLNVDFTIVSFLPNWSDADYIRSFLASKYVVIYKVVNKGAYVLHEKDKGKIINGTFDLLVIVLNSMHLKWGGSMNTNTNNRKKEITDGFANIIKIMKEETRNIK